MLYRVIVFLFFAVYYNVALSNVIEGGMMAVSVATSIKNTDEKSLLNIHGIFTPKGDVSLEKVMFVVDDDMNEKGATKLHLIIVYERELLNELKKMSSSTYFKSVKQLVKDHPDKMKIFQWTFVAKKRISKWIDIPFDDSFLVPLGGIVFANYSSAGEHRASVPTSCKSMRINLKKKDFQVVQSNN